MNSIASLFRRIGRTRTETLRECRRCGTGVGPGVEECPECDSPEIATYQLAP